MIRSIVCLALATGSLAVSAQSASTEPDASSTRYTLPSIDTSASETSLFDKLAPRPRLSVTLAGPESHSTLRVAEDSTFSWSLDAWEMNTASLAHIHCSRATRRLESFLVEDCRIIDQPLPSDAGSLVQLRGQWIAAPGLQIGAGAFAGRDVPGTGIQPMSLDNDATIDPLIPLGETVEGVNMNISFGLQTGRIGDLLLDLQLERYRRSQADYADGLGFTPLMAGSLPRIGSGSNVETAGRFGIGWQLNRFRADLTSQYRELPYWLGEQARGEGFSSFDIELSWRAPANASISVGVTNVLDQRPDAADGSDAALDASIDRIYGRIPYVRYKHDL